MAWKSISGVSSVCLAGVVLYNLLHVVVTTDIDLDSMKYKGSLIFGSALCSL